MKIYFILFITLLTSFLFAGEIELVYSEGIVLHQNGSKWIEIEEGDVVKDNAVIRLEKDAFAEFEGKMNNQVISFTLIEPGTYNVANFFTSRSGTGNTGLIALIGSKVDFLLNTPPSDKEASMGARAAEKSSKTDVTWDDAEDYLIDGILELEKNNLDSALQYLEQSLIMATPGEEAEIYYYISLAYYRTGLKSKALKTLTKAPPTSDQYFYNDYSILCGLLYAYSKNHQAAIDVLKSVKENDLDNKDRQALYLIRGISFFNIDNKQKAEENLLKVIEIDADSIPGKNAASILKQL